MDLIVVQRAIGGVKTPPRHCSGIIRLLAPNVNTQEANSTTKARNVLRINILA
jgi:hypothetical protein